MGAVDRVGIRIGSRAAIRIGARSSAARITTAISGEYSTWLNLFTKMVDSTIQHGRVIGFFTVDSLYWEANLVRQTVPPVIEALNQAAKRYAALGKQYHRVSNRLTRLAERLEEATFLAQDAAKDLWVAHRTGHKANVQSFYNEIEKYQRRIVALTVRAERMALALETRSVIAASGGSIVLAAAALPIEARAAFIAETKDELREANIEVRTAQEELEKLGANQASADEVAEAEARVAQACDEAALAARDYNMARAIAKQPLPSTEPNMLVKIGTSINTALMIADIFDPMGPVNRVVDKVAEVAVDPLVDSAIDVARSSTNSIAKLVTPHANFNALGEVEDDDALAKVAPHRSREITIPFQQNALTNITEPLSGKREDVWVNINDSQSQPIIPGISP